MHFTIIEKFDQAVGDYTSGLNLKQKILPAHSRQIAEAHYRLSLALDLTPGKLAYAVEQAEKAVASVDARLELLNKAQGKASDTDAAMVESMAPVGAHGMIGSLANDGIDGLSKTQLQAQLKEFQEMRTELAAKVGSQSDRQMQLIDPCCSSGGRAQDSARAAGQS